MRGLVLPILCCLMFLELLPRSSAFQRDSSCQIQEVLNRKGWDIPGLSKTVTRTAHARYPAEGIENVFVDILESKATDSSVTLAIRYSNSNSRVEIVAKPVDVIQIQRFQIDNQVFGYLVTAVPVGIANDGHRIRAASEELLYYYDPDGSGRFTVMRYASEIFFKIVVPDWAKQRAKTTRLHQPQ